jgi:DNA-binding IclR family transcriptional regulator
MSQIRDGPRTVKAVETSIEVIQYLRDSDGSRLHEVADELGLANSTVHQHLSTLVEDGFVVREGDTYHVGLEFLQVASYARNRTKANKVSRSIVRKTAEKTDEQAQFIVAENGRGYHVYTYPLDRGRAIDTRPGKQIYLHANAAGKSILAHLDEERVHEILDRWGMPPVTENTITDRDELFAELERTRERGYGYNREEHVLGYCGVAAPVTDQNDTVVGALAIGGAKHRFEGELMDERLPEQILEMANEFELQLKFS